MKNHLQICGFIQYRKIRNVEAFTAKLKICRHTQHGLITQRFEFQHTNLKRIECLAVDTFNYFSELFKNDYPLEQFSQTHESTLNYRNTVLCSHLMCWNVIEQSA